MHRIRSNSALTLGAFATLLLALAVVPGCTDDAVITDTGIAIPSCDGSAEASLVDVTLLSDDCEETRLEGGVGCRDFLCAYLAENNSGAPSPVRFQTLSDQDPTLILGGTALVPDGQDSQTVVEFDCSVGVAPADERGTLIVQAISDSGNGDLLCETELPYRVTVVDPVP